MTYKTAADVIDMLVDDIWDTQQPDYIEALWLAKEALLKLEPTPPVKVKDQDSVPSPLLEEHVCPTCGVHLCAYELIDTTNCPVCGQRFTPYNKDIGDDDGD